MSQCRSYHTETGEARCWGTKEMDPCSCDGDQRRCSFYDYLRERAAREYPRINKTLPQQLRIAEAGYRRMAPHMRSLIHQAASEIERLQAALDERTREAADVEQKRHGHWIEDGDVQICSECGEEHEWADYRAPYCDSCGAKMDGGRDDV